MRPLVPLTCAFIIGIAFSGRFGPDYGAVYALAFASGLIPAAAYLANARFRAVYGAPVFFFLAVLLMAPTLYPDLPENHIRNLVESGRAVPTPLGHDVEGVVAATPEFTGGRTRLRVEAERVRTDSGMEETEGLVMLTVAAGGAETGGIRKGDRVRFVSELSEPWNFGNPGEFDYRGWLAARGVYTTGFVKSARLLVKTGDGGGGGPVERARTAIGAFMDRSGGRYAGALKAVVTGDRTGISPALKDAFRRSGTSHVLAISGLHVGLVALFFFALATALMKRSARLMLAVDIKKAALLATLPAVALYGMVAGFPPSAARAVVMVGAYVAAFAMGRGRDWYNTLALAALVILAAAPASAREPSFQLSFAAVAAIIYFLPRLRGLLAAAVPGAWKGGGEKKEATTAGLFASGSARWLVDCLAVTIAAGIGTAPFVAYHFNTASPWGFAANVIVVPLMGPVVGLTLLSSALACLGGWGEWPAGLFLSGAELVFGAIVMVVRAFAELPGADLRVATPTAAGIAFFYLLAVSAVNVPGKKRRRAWAVVAVVALLALAAEQGRWLAGAAASREVKVTFISVGQGDSALVEFPGGTTMLVDGGGAYGGFDTGERVVGPVLWRKGIRRLDYVVLSHAQRDHMGGLASVVEAFSPREFWWNGHGDLGRLETVLGEQGTVVRVVSSATAPEEIGGAAVEVLSPPPAGVESGDVDINGSSVVMRIVYGKRSFLFTGDIGMDRELALLGDGAAALDSDVLKSPHHGSRYSSSRGFLSAVSPEVVVISAGRRNAFSFPHEDALDRYEEAGARVWRTDLDGAVTVATDGVALEVKPHLTGRGR